jgi:hypothetical protein
MVKIIRIFFGLNCSVGEEETDRGRSVYPYHLPRNVGKDSFYRHKKQLTPSSHSRKRKYVH